ncbi:unnamed protein product [Brachionus calyciflorus]|uniref:Uncharacterized protein n=1 Tax=Brachionus calyciflorus TaxID=104777 RepID=A0A813Q2L4_9BILA|nr:unnamed protein product [Brachionus calyciflorus]
MSSPNLLNLLEVDLSPFLNTNLNQSNTTLFNSDPNLNFTDCTTTDLSLDLLLEPEPVQKIAHNNVVTQLKSHLTRNHQESYHLVYTPHLSPHNEFMDDFNLPTPTSENILDTSNSDLSTNLSNLPCSSTMNYIQTPQTQTGIISRSNSQPDLANTINLTYYNYYYNPHMNNAVNNQGNYANKLRRYPSLTLKTNPSDFFNLNEYHGVNYNHECYNQNVSYSSTTSGVSSSSSLTATSQDDGLFLGVDAITDFLSKNSVNTSFLDDLPDLEDLMSLVTFETSSCISASSGLTHASVHSAPPGPQSLLPNLFEYTDLNSLVIDENLNCNLSPCIDEMNSERTTRSAPPSPTQQRKKQRPTTNLPWNKAWNKMDDDERSKTVKALTRIINDEMGLREQLEIIRILNPDTKLKPTDTQFIIDLKMIDDDKFKRIKDVIKIYGISFNEKPIVESPDCPLAKRELRIKRAQQRLKLKQKKDQRQVLKENKSGLFCKTEVVPLRSVLPEEDIDIDILS